jgi:PAS domain S-box-containing protein
VRAAARESATGPRGPRTTRRLAERLLIPSIATLMLAGWVAANWFGANRLAIEKGQLRDIARTAAAGLESADIQAMASNPNALDSASLTKVRAKLGQLANSSELLGFMYLLKDAPAGPNGLTAMTILADSEPEQSPFHGHPGEMMPIPPAPKLEEFLKKAQGGRAVVIGPLQNAMGTWFAAAAPLADPTGKVVAYLVAVSNANHFLQPVALNRLWVILTTMLVGALLLLFYVAQKQTRRDSQIIAAGEERYRALFSRMIDGFSLQEVIRDDGGRVVDFRFLEVNPAFEKMLGLPADQVLGRCGREVFPGIADRWVERYGAVALTGQPAHFEDFSASLGRHFEVASYQPAPGQFACIFTDVSDRRKAQAHVRLLAQAMEQTAEAILITDARGIILFVNQAFTRITGYTAVEVLGKTPSILASGQHKAGFFDDIFMNLRGGGTWSGRIVNRRKDGTLYTEDCTISPVEGESGKLEFFVEVKRDISKELAMEEQFHQVQRLESVGRLAAGVAHDLNNLLAPVLGYSELMLDDLPTGTQNHQRAGEIRKAAGKSRDLIRQLLAFSRKQVLSLTTQDLREIVQGMENLLRRALREDILTEFNLTDDPCLVSADRGKVEQVLMNLVVNAQDAMPGGGRLSISVSRVTLDGEHCKTHGGSKPGEYIQLSVTDTGMGIDEETSKHIFEPFFTTKNDMGTGLGLATVYGIVKQHGGNIWFVSRPGHGTEFQVYLPAARAPETIQPTPLAEPERAPGSELVLVVEDNEMVRNLAVSILRRNGYSVVGAAGGAEVQQLLAERKERLDLLLTDVVMPEVDGKQVRQLVTTAHPEVKVLFMSGYTRNVITQSGILEPGVCFVQKPFTVQELLAKVRNTLDGVEPVAEDNQ